MSNLPTPETDVFSVSFKSIDDPLGKKQWVPVEFTRKLERERDKIQTELEMWRDGNILHEVHRNELEKVEQERDEAVEEVRLLKGILDVLKKEAQ